MKYINGSELAYKRFIRLENGDLREVPKGKFIPKIGDKYWFLNTGMVACQCHNEGRWLDDCIIRHNPVFRTKEECLDYRDFLDTLDQYTFEPNWEDTSQEKWAICFNRMEHRIDWFRLSTVQYRSPCFESYEKGKTFVDAVGSDAVEKYMFDVWE